MSHCDRPRYWIQMSERRERLAELAERAPAGQEFHLLGGGVAALAAAVEILEMQENGKPKHTVRIYEASGRVGGRIYTKRVGDEPGPGEPDTRTFFERGAMRIPESHDYTWTYAREAGLERRLFLNDDRTHDVQGQVFKPIDLQAVAALYGVEDPDIDKGPGEMFGKHVVVPEMTQLDDDYADLGGRDYWAPRLLSGDITGPGLERIDRLSLDQVLDERLVAMPGMKEFIVDLEHFQGFLDRAFLMFIRHELIGFGKHLYELCRDHGDGKVAGGMDLLIDGLRERIEAIDPEVIETGREMVSIATNSDGDWQVDFKDGSELRRNGRNNCHLLCTVPFSRLRNLRLDGFDAPKRAAIGGLSYIHGTKVALHCKERFWEQDGIRGGRSMTDQPISSTYYPNDHHDPSEIPEDCEPTEVYSLYTQPIRTESEAELRTLAASPPKPGPWLMLSSYTLGQRAEDMARKRPRETVVDLKRVFPEVDFDNLVIDRGSETWYWNAQKHIQGAFVLPTPLNVSRYYQTARAPHRGVFFAGEHLSPDPGWIQGALYSSLYSVEHLLRTIVGEPGAPEG